MQSEVLRPVLRARVSSPNKALRSKYSISIDCLWLHATSRRHSSLSCYTSFPETIVVHFFTLLRTLPVRVHCPSTAALELPHATIVRRHPTQDSGNRIGLDGSDSASSPIRSAAARPRPGVGSWQRMKVTSPPGVSRTCSAGTSSAGRRASCPSCPQKVKLRN